MRSSSILALSAFAAGSMARFVPVTRAASACMSDKDAQAVAANFKASIDAYTDELADAAFTQDFTDYSDSVTELINSGCQGPQTLGEPTFKGLEAFKAGQGGQPPIPFEQLQIWHTCDTVAIRWRSAQTPSIVTGNIVMEAVPSDADVDYPWKIQTVYSEFNSGAWLVNLGQFVPTCDANGNGPPPPPSANTTTPARRL